VLPTVTVHVKFGCIASYIRGVSCGEILISRQRLLHSDGDDNEHIQ
jgi:hypothetical protein